VDISTLVIVIVALGSLAWLGFLLSSGMGRGAGEEIPPNFRPYFTDAELESRRLDRVLAVALTLATFLAISLPIYYLGEARRHGAFAQGFSDEAVERGRHIFEEEFLCVNCHGPGGQGGSAPFVEERSGIQTTWAAPSLNDVFYRYDEDEVRYWIVFGRANTPMPAWGLEGGGPMNDQQVEEVLAYLRSIQLDQAEVVGQVTQKTESQRRRLEEAERSITDAIGAQEARLAEIETAPERLPVAEDLLDRLRRALQEGFRSGVDSDGDGLTDAAEQQITDIMAEAAAQLGTGAGAEPAAGTTTTTTVPAQETTTTSAQETTTTQAGQAGTTTTTAAAAPGAESLVLDPTNPASTTDEVGEPVPDLDAALDARSTLETEVTSLQVTVDSMERLLEQTRAGLEFLQTSLREQRYAFDVEQLAADHFEGEAEAAERAALLFNAYCARCHTSGYSAGVPFTLEAGSGALGPALWERRTVVQFPDVQEHVNFIIQGSENGVGYGINGVGTGRMPGFGPVLPQEDIDLIVRFERGL
jgi:mono/diheme cytochrome c family protein